MTKQQIIEAARTSIAKGEDLRLWQAVEWMYEYGLMDYKQYTLFMETQAETRKTKTKSA
jgi:hypothetical protein